MRYIKRFSPSGPEAPRSHFTNGNTTHVNGMKSIEQRKRDHVAINIGRDVWAETQGNIEEPLITVNRLGDRVG